MRQVILSFIMIAGLLRALPSIAGDRDIDKTVTATTNNADAGKAMAAQNVYKIQILALCCPIPMQADVFHRVKNLRVKESVFNNQYIYTVGEYKSKGKAMEVLTRLKKTYQSAFVVEFVNGSRVKR